MPIHRSKIPRNFKPRHKDPPLFLMWKIHRVGHFSECFTGGIFIRHGVLASFPFVFSFLSLSLPSNAQTFEESQKTPRECDGANFFHCSTRVEMGGHFPILLCNWA
jgi:hypothetical protein